MYKIYDNETLNKLHQVEIEILDEFVRICDKYHLTFSLFAGTLLGAVRHKGFIPWDDDIDVCMMREDYEKFIKIAKDELKKEYYLDSMESSNSYLAFGKIRKNGTIFDEDASHHLKNHKGIYIDIFPIDNVFLNTKKSYFCAALFRMCNNTVLVKNKICKIKDLKHPIVGCFLRMFPQSVLLKWEKRLCMCCRDNKSFNVACYTSIYPFKKEIIARKDFLPTKKILFEGKKYSVMNNCEQYLSNVYGDYLKLPPKNKRVNHMPEQIDFGDK